MINDRNVRFVAVLSMVALFVAGAAVGFAVARLMVGVPTGHVPPRHGPQIGPMVDRFAAELGLREEQETAIHNILQEGRRAANDVMQRARPELEEIRHGMEDEIAAQLDTQQAASYRQMLKSGRHVIPGRPPPGRHKHGPHHGPPPLQTPPGSTPQ